MYFCGVFLWCISVVYFCAWHELEGGGGCWLRCCCKSNDWRTISKFPANPTYYDDEDEDDNDNDEDEDDDDDGEWHSWTFLCLVNGRILGVFGGFLRFWVCLGDF